MAETPQSESDRRAYWSVDDYERAKAKLAHQDTTPPESVYRTIQDTFSHALARIREERNIKPEQLRRLLEDRVGTTMSRGSLYRIENPKGQSASRPVRLDEAIEIAAALGVGLVDLLDPLPDSAGIQVGSCHYSDIGDQIVGEVAWTDYRAMVEEPDKWLPRPGYQPPEWPEPGTSARQEEAGLGELWRLFGKLRRTARRVAGRGAGYNALTRESAEDDVALVRAVAAQTKARIDEWEATETRRLLGSIEESK